MTLPEVIKAKIRKLFGGSKKTSTTIIIVNNNNGDVNVTIEQ